ncbi:MAG TPA: DUF4886 domain-containing protein [Myxococcales bacterium]|jgi:hypothetical protein|nr:DUF4886 domain-containing protein [Myxococcales bacterium]
MRALFVGNSYTEVNDMPGMLAQLAAATGARRLEQVQDCPGGFTIKQHWDSGVDVAQLRGSHFDWMVLQDQSQEPALALSTLETDLYPYVTQLDAEARAHGTRTMLFLTWGRQKGDLENFPGDTYDAMQDRLISGYETIAARLHLPVAPVGIAWRNALRQKPSLALWQADGSHPTVAGTYLGACVFHVMLFQKSPVGASFTAGLDAADARALQQIAADTVAAYRQP